jgi:hypothetical protein
MLLFDNGLGVRQSPFMHLRVIFKSTIVNTIVKDIQFMCHINAFAERVVLRAQSEDDYPVEGFRSMVVYVF